jgi:hypothetical protein
VRDHSGLASEGVQPQWVVRMARLLRGSAGRRVASWPGVQPQWVVRMARLLPLERAASWEGSCRLPKARILSEMFKFTWVHPGSDTKEQLSGQLPDPEVVRGARLLSVSSGVLTASSLMV